MRKTRSMTVAAGASVHVAIRTVVWATDAPAMRRETLTTLGVALQAARTVVREAFHALAYLIDDIQAVLRIA